MTNQSRQRAVAIAVDHLQSMGLFQNAGRVHVHLRRKNNNQKLFWKNRAIDLQEHQEASMKFRSDMFSGQYHHALYLLEKHPMVKMAPGLLDAFFRGWKATAIKDDIRYSVFREILRVSDKKAKNDALYHAVKKRVPIDIIKDLLDAGADVNAPYPSIYDSSSILIEAILGHGLGGGYNRPRSSEVMKQVQVMKLLLKRGADVRYKTPRGVDALWLYLRSDIYQNVPEGVKLLLDYGARPSASSFLKRGRGGESYSHLGLAIDTGNADIVKLILDAGASPNQTVVKTAGKPYNYTALELAVHMGHVEVAKLLMQRGAEVTPDVVKLAQQLPRNTREAMSKAINDHLKRRRTDGPNNKSGNRKRQRIL